MLKPQSISFKGGTARFTHVEPEPEPVFEPVEQTEEATTNHAEGRSALSIPTPNGSPEGSPDWDDITGRQ